MGHRRRSVLFAVFLAVLMIALPQRRTGIAAVGEAGGPGNPTEIGVDEKEMVSDPKAEATAKRPLVIAHRGASGGVAPETRWLPLSAQSRWALT